MTKPTRTAPTFPNGLEIFRAGRHTAQTGQVYEITDADVAAAAAAYDPNVHEAPLVIGHPEHDKPAYGWVRTLHAAGGVLQSDHHQVDPAFAEYFDAGRVKKRSSAFYHPEDPANPRPGVWYLRHVGFLGAQPPAVKGLRDPQFAEGDADTEYGLVHFSETDPQEHPDMSKELQEQLDAANRSLIEAKERAEAAEKAKATAEASADASKKQLAEFAEGQKKLRHDSFVAFAEGRVQAGTLLPRDRDMLVATLDRLDGAAPVEFAEGDTTRKVSHVQWLQDLITAGPALVEFAERATGELPAGRGQAKGKSDKEIDAAATKYAEQHKVTYADALKAVTRA